MIKGFEEAFMDAQASIISLTLELLETVNTHVQKIYIYIFQNQYQTFFNACFEKNNKIYKLNDLFDDKQIDVFFDCTAEEIEHIIHVCNQYDSKCPNEFKLIYNVESSAFDSEYTYRDLVSEDDISLVDRYHQWIDACKEKIKTKENLSS